MSWFTELAFTFVYKISDGNYHILGDKRDVTWDDIYEFQKIVTFLQLYYASNHLNGEKSHDSLKTRSIFAQVDTQTIKVFLKVGDNAALFNICCPMFRGSKGSQETPPSLKMRQIHSLETPGNKHQ